MMGFRFMKAAPTTYVLHTANGQVRREGPGLSFLYFAPSSTVAAVPLASTDVPFAFNEVAADFQPVTIQGQLTYRVADPRRLAGILDYSVGPRGEHLSDDPEALADRLVRAAQVEARTLVQRLPLREVLKSSDALVAEVLPALRKAEPVRMLGVEILALAFQSLKPTPEMAKALEAEAREALQRRADEAIYARRNAAVEQERMIKENELRTEIAVEEKKREVRETQMDAEIAVEEKRRQVRETQMAADIAVEGQRRTLIDTRVENERKDADSRAYAIEVTLKPVRDLDWKTLMAVNGGAADPRLMIALAFRELAENAQKIGELNVTPDLLKSLLGTGGK